MNTKIKHFAIVGGGTAGWSAAAMLAKRFAGHSISITLVESPEHASIGVGEATVPAITQVHKQLGIDEQAMLVATDATFKLGIEFRDWRVPGEKFFHPFSDFGVPIEGKAFYHAWLCMQQEAKLESHIGNPLEHYSLCASLAQAGKFSLPNNHASTPLAWYGYAYHFDGAKYANFLRDYAQQLGVAYTRGTVSAVVKNPTSGNIDCLVLSDGSQLKADFFIDCTGFKSRLLAQEYGEPFCDWSHWLPCNKAVVVQTVANPTPPPYTISTALDSGWAWSIPLKSRTGNGYVFSDNHITEDQAASQLLRHVTGKPINDPRVITFRAGMRENFWVKNCAAVGLASGFIEPLESTSISMIHTAIGKIIEHLPNGCLDPKATEHANHLNRLEYERIRDFILLHYWLSDRTGSNFWKQFNELSLPDTLQYKIDQWLTNAQLVILEQESFQAQSWLAMYSGFKRYPLSSAIDAPTSTTVRNVSAKMRAAIVKGVSHAPYHHEFLSTLYETDAATQ
ncbi:tryptophan halogenase family protein [Teredinibacter turnerae]|uniref:tryptophan halogenase family protein n=1 Tax=Teredinibacter turnerae TaxID=2426 RepID=UPI0030D5F901